MRKDIVVGILVALFSLAFLVNFVGNDVVAVAKIKQAKEDKKTDAFFKQMRLDEIERIRKSGRTR